MPSSSQPASPPSSSSATTVSGDRAAGSAAGPWPRAASRLVPSSVVTVTDAVRPSSRASTSGPIIVTSPAPQVSTTSPGRARSARCPATADQDGSKTTCAGGSGTAAATSAPVTPGTGSSRAA